MIFGPLGKSFNTLVPYGCCEVAVIYCGGGCRYCCATVARADGFMFGSLLFRVHDCGHQSAISRSPKRNESLVRFFFWCDQRDTSVPLVNGDMLFTTNTIGKTGNLLRGPSGAVRVSSETFLKMTPDPARIYQFLRQSL